jgi:LysR family hydrogen peroxide-inducible transcriptional activator
MPQPTLRQLSLLIAVADTNRFTLAAERAHISQPALSEQIAQLEHNLGTKLFERGRHGASLTPLGKEIVARARPILAHVRELEDVVHTAGKNLGGLIRLGALPTVGPYLLPSVIPELHAAHPELRLYIRELRTVELEARLREGVFDVLLSTKPDDTVGLVVEPLFEERLLLGLASDNALAKKRTIGINDLANEKVLTLESGHYLSARVRGLAQAAHAQLLVDYEGTSLDGLRQMVGLGMGVSLFPALYVHAEIVGDEAVTVRDIKIDDAARGIALIWRKSSPRRDDFLKLAERLRARGKVLLSDLAARSKSPMSARRRRPLSRAKRT